MRYDYMSVRAHDVKGRNLRKTPISKYRWKSRDSTKDVPYENIAIFSDRDKLLIIRAKPEEIPSQKISWKGRGQLRLSTRTDLGIIPSTSYRMLGRDD